MAYNFASIHRSIRITPAMEAGIANQAWEIEEIIELLEAGEADATDVGMRRRDRKRPSAT